MKRKIFTAISVFIALCSFGMLLYIISVKYRQEHFGLDMLPYSIPLYKSDNSAYSIGDTEKSIIIVYFKSDCQ